MKPAVSCLVVLLASALPACQAEAPRPNGKQLRAGRNIREVGFTLNRASPQVLFDDLSDLDPGQGTVWDLRMVPFDGGTDRLVVKSASERWGRPLDASGRLYVMHDEHLSDAMDAYGNLLPVATLARVTLTDGTAVDLPDVQSSFLTPARDGRLIYWALPPGATLSQLHFRDTDDSDRDLGPSTSVTSSLDGGLYYVTSDRSLTRIPVPGSAAQILATDVIRYWLRGDERYVVIDTGIPKGGELSLLDLVTMVQRPLPGTGIAHMLGFSPDGTKYLYSELVPPEGRGRIHLYDVATGDDTVIQGAPVPGGDIKDVSFRIAPPASTQALAGADMLVLRDVTNRMSIFRPGVDAEALPLGRAGLAVNFLKDGRFIVYYEQTATASGSVTRILSLDADRPTDEPRVLSPPGAHVSLSFWSVGRQELVFLAHFGQVGTLEEETVPSDVYFVDLESGDARLVAPAVGFVAIGTNRIIGIVRKDRQDQTGDLVQLDISTGAERLVGRSVADFDLVAACTGCDRYAPGARLAYIVRNRQPSERDGLWATTVQ